MTAIRRKTLYFYSDVVPQGWNIKKRLLAGKTLNIFLLAWISNKNSFTWKSCRSASCAAAYHTQASYVCWCCCWSWTSCHNLYIKKIDIVLPNCVLVRRWQNLWSLVTEIAGVNPFSISLVLGAPHWSHPETKLFPSQTCLWHLQVQVPAYEHPSSCAP